MPHMTVSARRGAAITAVLGLLSLFPPLATDMYLAALGDMAETMNASHAMIELSLSIFFLGLCFGQLVMGPLIDSLGRKVPLIVATLLYIGTSALLAVSDDIAVFNALRFLQALGACGGMVVGRAVVNDLYEGRRAAKAMTVLVMLLTIGPMASPTVGSLLLEGFGWRSIFVVMTLIGVLALVASILIVPETLPRDSRVAAPFRSGGRTMAALVKRRDFIVPAVLAGLVQAGLFAFITGSSAVFQGVFGLGAVAYGVMFAAIATALLIFGQINTWLLNHMSSDRILRTGLPIYAAITLVLVLVSGTGGMWLFVLPLWFSIGMVGLLSANAMHVAMATARETAGVGSAVLGAVQFGIAFTVSSGVALAGNGTPLPLALGLLIPAVLANGLLLGFGQKDGEGRASAEV